MVLEGYDDFSFLWGEGVVLSFAPLMGRIEKVGICGVALVQ
jgi:hypothetical protein